MKAGWPMFAYRLIVALDMSLGVYLDERDVDSPKTDLEEIVKGSNSPQIAMIWMRCAFSFGAQPILHYELWCGKPTAEFGELHSSWRLSNLAQAFDLRPRFHFFNNRFNLSLQQNYAYPANSAAEDAARTFADSFLAFFYDFPVQAYGGRAHVHGISKERVLALASSAVTRFNAAHQLLLHRCARYPRNALY